MAPVEFAGNLHARYSKIHIVIVDTSKGKGQDAVVTTANVDPIKIKILYEKVKDIKHDSSKQVSSTETGAKENRLGIGDYRNMTPTEALQKHGEEAVSKLEGLIPIFEKNADKYPVNERKIQEIRDAIEAFKRGTIKEQEPADMPTTITLFFERKINPNEKRRNENGEYPVTTLQIDYNPRMNNCWNVIMENGWGQIDTRPNGGIFIKRGSYRSEKQTRVVVGDDAFREMVRQTNDYIFQKELLFMSQLQKQLFEYEERKRKEWVKE